MCRILFILLALFSCTSCAIWPLSWEFNNEKRFLGPLISYQNENDTDHLTIRPLLTTYDSNDGGIYNYLYPLGHVSKEHSYFVPLYRSKLFGEDSDTSLTLFFWGRSKKQGRYGGIFPFTENCTIGLPRTKWDLSCGLCIALQNRMMRPNKYCLADFFFIQRCRVRFQGISILW